MAVNRKKTSNEIKSLTQTLNCVRVFRFFFFFYAFISFIFWFLNCFEVNWLYLFNWMFVIPYQIVTIFYKPVGVAADFSLVIIGGISLLFYFLFDLIQNNLFQKINDLQEEEEKRLYEQKLKRKKRSMPQKQLDMPTVGEVGVMPTVADLPEEHRIETAKLIFIISPHIHKIKRKESELELTFQEVETWKQRINKKLIENVNYSKPLQKGYYRKNLFLIYKDFNYADDFIYYIKPTMESIIMEFQKYNIGISFCCVLSALGETTNLEKELDCMDTVLSLNFDGEIIGTNRFKLTYDKKPTRQYTPMIKGEYNLSKNLTISNRQPLYLILDKTKKGE